MAEQTIGDWTPSLLTKWMRDLFLTQPPDFLPHLKVEDIRVDKEIILRDKIRVTNEPHFRLIAKPGQPAFLNSWVNFGSNWQDAGFSRDGFGWVHLRGIIKSGVVGSAAFMLPPGYRPALSETFIVRSNGTTGGVEVLADGSVIPVAPSNNTYVSLSNVRFRTS